MGLEGRVGGRGGVTGNMRCTISKRGTVGRKRGTGRVGERRRYDDTSCGGFRCRRNTPANRDPLRSPEQQDCICLQKILCNSQLIYISAILKKTNCNYQLQFTKMPFRNAIQKRIIKILNLKFLNCNSEKQLFQMKFLNAIPKT